MAGPVNFNYATFVAAYPEFQNLTEPQLKNYFEMTDAFFANDTSNPAFGSGVDGSGVDRMTRLAYLLTAHVAKLMAPRDAAGNPSATGAAAGTIGQMTSASEGSVSVGFAEFAKGSNAQAAWFAQTQYGIMYWQATAQYRMARYLPNPTMVPSSIFPLFPMGYRGRY